VSWLVLWWMDPKVFGSPLALLYKSVHSSAEFLERTTPWYIVPSWVAIQVPVIVLVLFVLGSVVVARRLFVARFRTDVAGIGLVIVCSQALSMPIAFAVTQSPLSADLRQLLFAVPPTALVATFGASEVCRHVRGKPDRRVAASVVVAVAAGLVVPVVAQAMLFPYNYVYSNALAQAFDVDGHGEYYRGSARELVDRIPPDGRLICSPEGVAGQATRLGHLSGWTDCQTAELSPISSYATRFRGRPMHLDPDQFWAISFNPEGTSGENCSRIASVSRRGPWQHVVMATLSLCRLPFPTLSVGSVTFRASDHLAALIPDEGWYPPAFDQTQTGLLAAGRRSTMTFRLPSDVRGGAVRLEVRTADAADPAVTFGGVDVPTRSTGVPSRLVIEIPRELVDRSITEPLTLAFRSRTSAALDLKVLSMTLQPEKGAPGG